eukprot:gene5393-6066_t
MSGEKLAGLRISGQTGEECERNWLKTCPKMCVVLKEACKVIGLLIEADRQNPVLMNEDIIDTILHAMEWNKDDVGLNQVACHAIANMCEDKNVCNTIENNCGSYFIRRAIGTFPRSRDIALDGLRYLENIVRNSIGVSNDSSFLGEVFDTMVNYPDDAQVQESACRFVSLLLCGSPSVESRIGESDGQFSIHNCVMTSMNVHIDDTSVFQAACSALQEMSSASERLQELFVAKGLYVTIVTCMRANKESFDTQECGYGALRALCFKNVLQEGLLLNYDFLNDIKETLHVHCNKDCVLKEALSLLACLATDMEIVRRQCMLELVHERVVEIMKANSNSVLLLKTCFETLVVFAASDEQSMLIGALDSVEQAMRKFQTCSGLQISGCILIQLLAIDEVCDNQILCFNIVSLVCEAMSNFPFNEELLTEGAVALKLIAETEMGRREMIKQESFQYLFHIIQSITLPVDNLRFAAEALLLLSHEQHYRDRMLQWAVINDKFKEALWLLKHGADVNSGTLNRPNLVIAAEVKSPKMLSFLLRHGASNALEALQVTRRQNDEKLTGILLRHIGLEKKSGVLAWGNLNIIELRGNYFSPPLIGKKDTSGMVVEDECWNDHFERASEHRLQRLSVCDMGRKDRIDSVGSSEADEVAGSPNVPVKLTRPDSLTGAVLPFVNMDPRVEGPLDLHERFVRSETPTLRNSYPGHPESKLVEDVLSVSLVSSPDKEAIPKHSPMQRSASVVFMPGIRSDSTETSPSTSNKHRKISAAELCSRSMSEPKQLITYADMSFNSLSSVELLASHGSVMKEFFNGLVGLDLSNNKISHIDVEVLCELKQLKKLHLVGNELDTFPYAIINNKTLETLNLRKNKISQIDKNQLQCCITLANLDISDNQLKAFPAAIGDFFPTLRNLNLSRNQICKLPSTAFDRWQISNMDLSHNQLESVPAPFLDGLVALTKLDLSHNCLISLPDLSHTVTYDRLSHLKLSGNKLAERAPWYVPRFVLQLPCLACLDISHNNIVQVPSPMFWKSRCLKELNFDNNRIKKLDLAQGASYWSTVCRLSLANNNLEQLPNEIGLLVSLVYLNISHNKITTIPEDLGRLRNLSDFPRDGLSLDLHPSIAKGTAREICTFLYSTMKHAMHYVRMKLMVVGAESKGKTTLLRTLQGLKLRQQNAPTIGIEIKTWNLQIPRNHWARAQSKQSTFVLTTWDFAGQEDFYSTHQCFLTSRALYLAVFDASRGSSDLESLRAWLLNINAAAPGAPVILVGTNADNIKTNDRQAYFDELQSKMAEFMDSAGFPVCTGTAIVCSIKKGSDIETLRQKILESVAELTVRESAPLKHLVPKSYVQMEDVLKKEAYRLESITQIPVITKRALVKITQDNNLSLEREELDQAVKFLHESGALLHFDDPLLKLEDCYFIHPEWLSQMMAQVVTVREINPFVDEQGVLMRADVPLLFRGDKFQEAFIDNYLSLLQKFEVIIPLGNEKFLIPSKLSKKPPGFKYRVTQVTYKPHQTLSRYYTFPYIPVAFWSRLISRLMLFHSPLQDEDEKTLIVEYWRDGIFRFWSEEKYFAVTTSESLNDTLEIVVPVSQGGYELLGYLVDHIDTLIEEWYPGLARVDARGNPYMKKLAQCNHCQLQGKHNCFSLDDCISQSYEKDSIWCPTHEGEVFLRDIAPDVLLADIDGRYLIDESELDQKERDAVRIGGGAYGSVYQNRYKGKTNVAVKVFKAGGNIVPHRYLRQEVNILRHLRHPSLVSMIGVCLRPSRCLVMELAQIGSLQKVLSTGLHLSRAMQHRVASQVCEGLAHLHKHNIVYRDMKPSNILIFSLSLGIPINAKISDYGISQYITPMGFRTSGGTEGFRAPEVVKEDCLYNKKADIFSLGITIYALVTHGGKPFGESQFQYDMDTAALSKSAIKPITSFGYSPWPDMEHIIACCLESKPCKRPTAQAIFEWLSSAEALCLKQEIVVCKGSTVECMAIHKSTMFGQENLELWIASQNQISWFPLTKKHSRVHGCQGTILRSQHVLCICATSNGLILAGTREGTIIVFDCNSHEQINEITQISNSPVLCLEIYPQQNRENLVLAALDNGQLAVFEEKQLKIKACSKPLLVEVFSHSGGHEPSPVTCIEVYRRKCYLGFGSSIAVVDMKDMKVDSVMTGCGEGSKNIRQLAIGANYMWIISKDSSTIRCLNIQSGHCFGSFDCYDVIKEKYPDVTKIDCRTVSMHLRRGALWIGCGGGQMIIAEPNVNFKTLAIIWRHSASVRCIIEACGKEDGKPLSLVLTGGFGFKERSQSVRNEADDSGHVLVWDSELPSQDAYLKTLHKTREAMVC